MKVSSFLRNISLSLLLCGFISAGEIFSVKQQSDLGRHNKAVYNASEGIFTLTGKNHTVFCGKRLVLDPARQYRLSADIRVKPGTPPCRVYLGYAPFNADHRLINPKHFRGIKNSFTELSRPVKKGDKLLYVKDCSKWDLKNQYTFAAPGAKADNSDLPNFNAVLIAKKGIEKTDSDWKITLTRPVQADMPAGTGIRQHTAGGTFIYNAGAFNTTEKWTTHTGLLQGTTTTTYSDTRLWPGTAYVNVLILVMKGQDNTVTEFRNLKVEEIPAKP